MTASEQLKQHILKRTYIHDDKLTEFCESFNLKHIKKRQFLVQPGFVPRHRYYVVSGSFRAYVIGGEGQEHTIQLAIDDWWITDYNNYLFQQPASMFIVALEDSTVLQLDYEREQALKQSHHGIETYFRIAAENTAAYMARRIISNLTMSAEQRYEEFLHRYTDLANKVPQYALASFLGMTTEYLSRLRNKRVSGKS